MAIVLVPDFRGQFSKSFARHVSVILFQAVQPDYKIVTLDFRQRQNIVFQFSQAHYLRDTATTESRFQGVIGSHTTMLPEPQLALAQCETALKVMLAQVPCQNFRRSKCSARGGGLKHRVDGLECVSLQTVANEDKGLSIRAFFSVLDQPRPSLAGLVIDFLGLVVGSKCLHRVFEGTSSLEQKARGD